MRFETAHGLNLPKIGFGTWSIGGDSSPDPHADAVSMAALRSAIDRGYTHFDTAEMYAGGHAEELLGQAVRASRVQRSGLIITTKVLPEHLGYENLLQSCDESLRRLGLKYIDLYLIHWPNRRISLAESFRALNKLVRDGKVKHVGVSNFDTDLLEESRRLCEGPIVTNQIPYSLADRSYVKNGVLAYCQRHDIIITAYSPMKGLERPASRRLTSVAKQRNLTTHQIALAWLCSQTGVITIPMSLSPQHQQQNLEAADVLLTADEMKQLD